MADIDIDRFEEHESRPEEPTDEHIPLDPVTPGISPNWDHRGVPGPASYECTSQRIPSWRNI